MEIPSASPAQIMAAAGLLSSSLALLVGLGWAYRRRHVRPRLAGELRRGFWILVTFGACSLLPLGSSLVAMNAILVGVGLLISRSSACSGAGPQPEPWGPLVQVGRAQCWLGLMGLVDLAVLHGAGVLRPVAGSVCSGVLASVVLQLVLAGTAIWLSVMIPVVCALRSERGHDVGARRWTDVR